MIRLVLLSLLLSSPAWAADPMQDVMVRARAHFEAGRALYTLGRFEEALTEFVAGYQLLPRPEFLLDIAHCQRHLGNFARARSMYRQFLVEARPGDPRIDEVRKLLAELPATPSPAPIAQPNSSPMPELVVAAPAPRASGWKRHWWLVPVAGVVAAGVAVGIYFAVRVSPLDCGAAGLGCVDARGR